MRTWRRSLTGGLVTATLLLPSVSPGAVGAANEADEVEQRLAAVTAERDALLAEKEAAVSRHEACKANMEMVSAVVADPDAYGTEEEVLDLLDTLAAPATIYGDAAFGVTTWRSGWRQTMYGGVDADIRTWREWVSDDGSQGGSLWTWYGTAANGESFTLEGIALHTCDENGLPDWVYVYYPYEHSEVQRAFSSGN